MRNIFIFLIVFCCSTISRAQFDVSEELLKINKYFDSEDCYYVTSFIQFYCNGKLIPSESKEVFAAKFGGKYYNKISDIEIIQIPEISLVVDNRSRSIVLTSTPYSSDENQLTGLLDKFKPIISQCQSSSVKVFNNKYRQITMVRCDKDYPLIEIEYSMPLYQVRKISMEFFKPGDMDLLKMDVIYNTIQRLKNDDKSYFDISKYVVQSQGVFSVIKKNYTGDKFGNNMKSL